MSYYEYVENYYKQLVPSGRFPYPYPSRMPTISNPGCVEQFYARLNEDFTCHNSLCYDTYYYQYPPCDKIPLINPCIALGFFVKILVSNILPPPPGPALPTETPPLPPVTTLTKPFIDPNLLDPWGILVTNDIVWVANAGSGMMTGYTLVGQPLTFVNVFGPFNNLAQPTGIVKNTCSKSYIIHRGPNSLASFILIATRHGTINGYNKNIDPNNSYILIDRSQHKCIYTGITMADRIIYVTDFYNQKIDVFGPDLKQIDDYPFIDEHSSEPIPGNYSPFNIVNIRGLLYVTYAKQSPNDSQFECYGHGFGYISIFTPKGEFVRRFTSCGFLNAPWGMNLVPSCFGFSCGTIMVANVGNGIVSIFDEDGNFINNLHDQCYNEIVIPGLRALSINPNFFEVVYWSASRNLYQDAFVGTINIK